MATMEKMVSRSTQKITTEFAHFFCTDAEAMNDFATVREGVGGADVSLCRNQPPVADVKRCRIPRGVTGT